MKEKVYVDVRIEMACGCKVASQAFVDPEQVRDAVERAGREVNAVFEVGDRKCPQHDAG